MEDVRGWRQVSTRRECREQPWTVVILLKKHMPNIEDRVPCSGTARPNAVDADVDVPAVCILATQPALKRQGHRAFNRHHALSGLSRPIVLEEHRDPVG